MFRIDTRIEIEGKRVVAEGWGGAVIPKGYCFSRWWKGSKLSVMMAGYAYTCEYTKEN